MDNSSANGTPRLSRKRHRSVTPSEGGSGLNGSSRDDVLRSPLAKRKKLAADRTGFSKLKEAVTADELEADSDKNQRVVPVAPSVSQEMGDADDDDGDDEEEEDEEDDFLARELEEEWG